MGPCLCNVCLSASALCTTAICTSAAAFSSDSPGAWGLCDSMFGLMLALYCLLCKQYVIVHPNGTL